MKITNKAQLIEYIKNKLGDGYTQIVDISAKSYIDAIDDATDVFFERVFEGSEESFISIPLEDGKTSYKMPDNIISVTDVLDNGIFSGIFSNISGYSFIDALDYQMLDIMDYVLFNNLIETYNSYLNDEYKYSYNSIYNNLKIFKRPSSATEVIVRCYTIPEESEFDEFAYVYNHDWVKKRAYANVLERWYIAYLKHEADGLFDGNVKIDKVAIRDEYKEKLEETEVELDEIYTGLFGAFYR